MENNAPRPSEPAAPSPAPDELIDLVADLMRKHGPDRHIDGHEIIAQGAWEWCNANRPALGSVPPAGGVDLTKEIAAVRSYIARSKLYYLEPNKANREMILEMAEWGLSRIQHYVLPLAAGNTGGTAVEPDMWCPNCEYLMQPKPEVEGEDGSAGAPPGLTWTREKPKVDGFYQHRMPSNPAGRGVSEIRVNDFGEPEWYDDRDESWNSFADGVEWSGPIPEPQDEAPAESAEGRPDPSPGIKMLYQDEPDPVPYSSAIPSPRAPEAGE